MYSVVVFTQNIPIYFHDTFTKQLKTTRVTTEVPTVKFLLFPVHSSRTIRISNQHLYRAGDHDTDYNKAFRIRTGRAVLLPHV